MKATFLLLVIVASVALTDAPRSVCGHRTHHFICAVVETLSANRSTEHAASPVLTTPNGRSAAVDEF